MFVESAQNFEVLKEINFSLFGMGPKYRRRAERMKPDDRVLFYVKGLRKWPASATIASTYFEDDSPLWSPTTRNESFQYRVKLRADIVLDEEDYIDALLLAPQLEYIKRWVPGRLALGLLGPTAPTPAGGFPIDRGRDAADRVEQRACP